MSLDEVSIPAGCLRRESLLIGDRAFYFLLRGGICFKEGLLPSPLSSGASYVCLHRVFAGLRGGDLGVGLVDSGQRAVDAGILKFALAAVVFESCFCGLDPGGGLGYLSN